MGGPVAKVSAHVVEILGSWEARAKVSSHQIEVLWDFTEPDDSMFPGLLSTPPGAYGDLCNTTTPDAAWTARNIASVTGDGSAYSMTMDAQGDAYTRAFTDPAGSFGLVAHITGMTDGGGMIGLCALDASGNGRAFSRYNDANSYIWRISGWAYSATGPNVGGYPTVGDHWLSLRRDGTGTWYGRYSSDGVTWSSETGGESYSTAITQIGIMRAYTSGGTQNIALERVLYGVPAVDSTGFTGGSIVSQDVVEALMQLTPSVRVGQNVIEVLTSGDGYTPPAGGGGTTSFGFST